MTVDEVAEELELTPQRVREFCQQGRLGRRVGRQWVITREELEAFKQIPRPPGRPRKDEEE